MGGKVFPESPAVAAVAKYVAGNPGQTQHEIAEVLKLSRSYIKNVITTAVKVGLIDSVWTNRFCLYYEAAVAIAIKAERAEMEKLLPWNERRAEGQRRRREREYLRSSWGRDPMDAATELADTPRVTRTEAGRYPPPMTTAPASVFAWRP